MNNKQEADLHVVLVGPPFSGKTSMIFGYQQEYNPTKEDCVSFLNFVVDGKELRCKIWDPVIPTDLHDKKADVYKNGDIVVIVFDSGDSVSFHDASKMCEQLIKADKFKYNAKFAIVRTKSDLGNQLNDVNIDEMASFISGKSEIGPNINLFTISVKNQEIKKIQQQLCEGFYKILNDPDTKCLTDLNIHSSEAAPIQNNNQTFSLNEEQASVPVTKNVMKYLLLGDAGCGKSSLRQQFSSNQFAKEYIPTIGVDFSIKNIEIEGQEVKLQIWDLAGMVKFQPIVKSYYRGGNVVFFIFDCSNQQSFKNLSMHVSNFQQELCKDEDGMEKYQKMCKFIVGNGIDKQRIVSYEKGQQFAKGLGFQYGEVSSKQGTHVEELFLRSADIFMKGV